MQEIIAIFEGNLGIDEFIGRLQTRIEARNDLKEKDVYITLFPLAKKNIELQKQQYGKGKENIIVIPQSSAIRQNVPTNEGGSSPSHSKGNSAAQTRDREANSRSESANATKVTRYSLPEGGDM